MLVGDLGHGHRCLSSRLLLLLRLLCTGRLWLGCVGRGRSRHLFQIAFVILGKVVERVDNDARIAAVVHVDRGGAHPRLQVVNRQRDVLRVALKD